MSEITPGVADAAKSNAIRTRAHSAYQRLREEIIRGELAPLSRLKVVSLVERLGVNSSAVREALSRLAAEHLVEARDQQGFRVAAISQADLDDLMQARIDIESLMLRRSITSGGFAWEQRLKTAHAAMSTYEGDRAGPDGQAVHREFHAALLGGHLSPTLLRIRNSLYELGQRYRSFALHKIVDLKMNADAEVDAQHDEMIAAALARDADRAVDVLTRHNRRTVLIVGDPLQKHNPSADE